jgi:nucleoside-diphosphate-sugar epimerase
VFASSVAVYGGDVAADGVGDGTKQTPRSTYGMTKAVGELLVNDATRKGFIDGRTARLPTVIIRPGAPNRAASGFASALFREPLHGVDTVVPVPLETPICVIGHRAAVDGLIALHDLDGDRLGDDRAVSLPGLTVRVNDMIAALERVRARGDRHVGIVRFERDPAIEAVVASWPAEWRTARARTLGLPADRDLDGIVADYLADFGGG